MVHNRGVKEKILAGKEKVDDVILRRSHSHAATLAQVAEDVKNLGIATKLFQQGYDDLDVFFLHHVESFWGVVEDAVEDVHHASALATQFAKQPVETLSLGKLRTVGVVASDDSG